MKKTNGLKKLQLATSTVRLLDASRLPDIVGGRPRIGESNRLTCSMNISCEVG